jgi:ketosteroid isomerase-like protein
VEIVRQPVDAATRNRRGLDERFVLRFPRATAAIARFVLRRPLHSRVRKVILSNAVAIAYGAANRGDYDPPFALYASDCEFEVPRQLASLGKAGVRGRQARIEWQQQWIAEWGEFRFDLDEMIDTGERLVITGRIHGAGRTSGANVDSDWGIVFTLGSGLATREQVFLDRSEALEAAGLSE